MSYTESIAFKSGVISRERARYLRNNFLAPQEPTETELKLCKLIVDFEVSPDIVFGEHSQAENALAELGL